MPKKKNKALIIVLALLILGSIFVVNPFAFIPPQTYKPGDVVQFDSSLYMDCGPCGLTRINSKIDGYVIKVFNSNGNMVKEETFQNWKDVFGNWYYECGKTVNTVYQYTVPQGAIEGNWFIVLEIATSPIWDPGVECVVAIDEASFLVGKSCTNQDQEVKYCIDQNIRYYKPAGSCQITYTTCNQEHGQGYKCVSGECQLTEICGDDICDDYENPYNCYEDCGSCGDKLCTGTETPQNCPEDCFSCGDGTCNIGEKLFCGHDCAVCGDGECYWYEEFGEDYACQKDCFDVKCGDGICQQCNWWEIMGCDYSESSNPNDDNYCASDCGSNECPPIWGFIPDIPCLINKFFNDLANSLAPLVWIASIFGFIMVTLISKKRLGGYVGKKYQWYVALFIGILAGILIYLYFWLGLLFFILYMIIINFVPIVGHAKSMRRAVR